MNYEDNERLTYKGIRENAIRNLYIIKKKNKDK